MQDIQLDEEGNQKRVMTSYMSIKIAIILFQVSTRLSFSNNESFVKSINANNISWSKGVQTYDLYNQGFNPNHYTTFYLKINIILLITY